MSLVIGLIAQGAMGAGLGARLVANGLEVRTVLEGRSSASAERAAKAGMIAADWADMAQTDIFLSVVPPADAHALATRLAPVLKASAKKPVYADLNAVSPDTAKQIAATIAPTGCVFADGGILGQPPGANDKGPSIFVSGEGALRIGDLKRHGLDIRVMDAPVGAASSVKMCFAGINKGFTAMAAMMILAATRDGAADYLRGEVAAIAPGLSETIDVNMPRMYDKAYRFAPEMEEIAGYLSSDAPSAQVYRAFAQFYERIAADMKGGKTDVDALRAFTAMTTPARKA
jgi:3-hydroxyisobutyrate dehydrogenase-like beta-hydroxyacid dehydrogenase